MPATYEPAVGEGGVMCRRCGRLLNGEAVLVIVGDELDVRRYCTVQHAADDLNATPAPTPFH